MAQIRAIQGGINTSEAAVLAQVQANIRRQCPQVKPFAPQTTPLALVAGGPSLLDTQDELRDLVFRGWKVAAVNGAYQWCIDHNIKPSIAVVLDARAGNAPFLATEVPGCQYLLASQCHPDTFDMVAGRDVWIFHAISYDEPEIALLDAFYGKDHYCPVTGGSTVTVRALSVLRMLGFLRMDVFGFDSCWMRDQHHAYAQALNDRDGRMRIRMVVDGEDDRTFECASWHIKQWEDFQGLIKERGHLFDLHIHGDGLIAHGVKTGARLYREQTDSGSPDPAHRGRRADAVAVGA